jgi:GTP-binding protein Era
MMMAVKSALEDADLALLILDIRDDWGQNDELFKALDLRVPALVVLNKTDKVESEKLDGAKEFFKSQPYCRGLIEISALKGKNLDRLVELILGFLPEGVPFYDGEEISDLSTRFFVSEIIRARIYDFYAEEIPYHSTVLIREFKEKESLTKIAADIVVQRETQKGIILGEGGRSIKKLGTESRKEIEKFLGVKVFLELFVKLRPHWREDDLYLKEYGY